MNIVRTSKIELTYQIIFDEINQYIKNKDSFSLIEKAYLYAEKLHANQKRKSGEPYFTHLKCVAYELACLRCGPKTIAAGFLHDVCEDCGITNEELAKEFDQEIADLVDAVTKIGNLEFKDEKEYQAANHRKIFIAMAKDIRVILIKLVDRLHNMRTLKYMTESKQKKISQETLEVYAPIAHKLGINEIKNELEDLCFYYLDNDSYYSIARQLEAKKNERDGQVNDMILEISDTLSKHDIPFRAFGRSKHIYSIHKKMITKNKRFNEILDLLAIRIITRSELNCYEILGYIHATYKPIPGRLKDYIAVPKMNMYQSLHTTVIGNDGHIFEIQIRTEEMDLIADRGIAAHWRYKENSKYDSKTEQKEIEEKLSWFKDLINVTNEVENSQTPQDYMNYLTKDVFEANVYVMTPKGRVIDLPNGATPIDFAYRIHTEVGHTTVGALVNDSLVPINTILKTGDVVELKTNKNSGPSEDWLKFVKTNHAKNKIRSYISKKELENKQEYVKTGENMLKEELRKRGFEPSEYMDQKKLEHLASSIQLNSYIDLMYAIAVKSLSLQSVITKITNVKKQLFDIDNFSNMINQRNKNRKINSDTGVYVTGIDSMKTQLSVCCNPVYGDNIIGYVSKGQGVKVHRCDCPNIKNEKTRLIEVLWEEEINHSIKYQSSIEILSKNRNLLLSDIITTFGQYKANILSINSTVHHATLTAKTKAIIQVDNLDHLRNIITNIKKIEDVISVERVIK